MSTLEGQLRRVRALEARISPPKTHVFVIREGGDATEEQWAQVRPGDKVILQEVPAGYMDYLFE